MYGIGKNGEHAGDPDSEEEGGDIEAEIQKEIDGIRKPAGEPIFTSVRLDTQCCKLKAEDHFLEPTSR